MQVTKSEAVGALHDIERAQARTAEMRGYRNAGPYLILWGVIWALGYALMAVQPLSEWGLIWLPLDLIGIAASIGLGMRGHASGVAGASRSSALRNMAAALFIALFIAATYAIFAPTAVEPYIVFPGLIVGLIYVVSGLLWMPRLAWIGLCVFVLSLVGFFLFREWLLLWMAAVGGGGLMLGGWWLRTA